MLLSRARVYAFPQRSDAGRLLTIRDKLDLHHWGQHIEAAGFQCVLGRDRNGPDHEYIQLRSLVDATIGWTLVRSGRQVRVWRGSHGRDLGSFADLGEAVAAVLEASSRPAQAVRPPPPRAVRGRLPSASTPSASTVD